jgi:diguanylate cyclase (GGDEF)-like protein
MADARTGSRQSESAQARWTAHDFAVFSAVLTGGYLVFYLAYDGVRLRSLVVVTAAGIVAQVGAVVLARVDRQLAAALISIVFAIAQIVAGVSVLGWESGLHLYLIAAGVLVFVAFTDRQAAWRWIFIVLAGAAFIVCQTVLTSSTDGRVSPGVLAALFSFNAVLTALLVFALAALSYYRAHQARMESARLASQAEYLANTDALTGLSNRRPVVEVLESVSAPGKAGYAVAIADLDRFKILNDTYGHQCGDAVLAHLAGMLKSRLRTTDTVGRWGGEEFIVILPNTTLEHAVRLMERLRASVETQSIPCGDHNHAVTVSIGVADGVDDGLSHHVVKRADDALYDAKKEGRNAVRSRPFEFSVADVPVKESPRAHRRELA